MASGIGKMAIYVYIDATDFNISDVINSKISWGISKSFWVYTSFKV